MSILNVAPENNDYDGLNEDSTDIERLNTFFAILLKSTYGESVDPWKLKLKYNQQVYFESLLIETGLVVDESGSSESSRFKLTSKGTVLLNQYGSYSNLLKQIQQEKKVQSTKSKEREILEMQKLRGEVDDLQIGFLIMMALKQEQLEVIG